MGKLTPTSFLSGQFSSLPPVETFKVDLSGKTVIVVGSNVGLGLEAARHFATMNPSRLILACRNVQKGQQALASIQQTTKYAGGEVWAIDLTDFSSVSAFADRFEREGGGRLDVLVENSGIYTEEYRTTKDGWESTLQTNHLGTALLAFLLLPYLTKTPVAAPTPRLVIVASEVHFWTKLTPTELNSPKILEKLSDKEYCDSSVMKQRYFITKLLNVFFVRAFAARLAPTNPVVVNAVNPGWCHSEINREESACSPLRLVKLMVGRSTEMGSRTLVHAAVGTPANGSESYHGKYMSNCVIEEESDFALSKVGQDAEIRVWNETIDILSKVDPRVPAIVSEYLNNAPNARVY